MGLTAQQIAQYAAQAGFTGWNLVTAVAVALAESSGNPSANNTNGEDSRGLWQINVAQGAHPQLAALNLFDPLTNAQQAYAISSGGSDWSAWSTFTNGAYKSYINQATAAAAWIGVTGIVGGAGASLAQSTTQTVGAGGGPLLPGVTLPNVQVPSFSDIAGAIGSISGTIANAFNDLKAVGDFVGQPNMVRRALLLVGGGVVATVGLILFALSFVHVGGVKVG